MSVEDKKLVETSVQEKNGDLVVDEEIDSSVIDPIDFDIDGIDDSRSKYTRQQKIQAVAYFAATGDLYKAAKYSGVRHNTLKGWKATASWWPEALYRAQQHKNHILDAQYTRILAEAQKQLLDRVTHGEFKIVNRKLEQVPMSGRDLAYTSKLLYENRALMRGDATSRVERISENDRLVRLQEKFETIGRQMQAKTIEGEVVKDDKKE